MDLSREHPIPNETCDHPHLNGIDQSTGDDKIWRCQMCDGLFWCIKDTDSIYSHYVRVAPPAAPTPVPLEAREWMQSSEIVGKAAMVLHRDEFDEWTFRGDKLAEILESYASHVNAALMKSVDWWKHHAALALKERDIAESRISVLERERDEARALNAEMRQAGRDMELSYVRELANSTNELDAAESQLSTLKEALKLAQTELRRVPAQGYRGWREADSAVERALTPPTTL